MANSKNHQIFASTVFAGWMIFSGLAYPQTPSAPLVPEQAHVRIVREKMLCPVFFQCEQPGCMTVISALVCRPDGMRAEKFSIRESEILGSGTRLMTSRLTSDGCLILELRLSVDHTGEGGRTCTQPFSRIVLDIDFD